jgi:acyl-CoA reductase-like NAD-dependent aldehyde dehydrogenase
MVCRRAFEVHGLHVGMTHHEVAYDGIRSTQMKNGHVAAIWTLDIRCGQAEANCLRAGKVRVNGNNIVKTRPPAGGLDQSGIRSELGESGPNNTSP